ncbi:MULTISPECIES: KaiC domain-containing protein [Haloferax]|uniref:Circadian clock protein KaiC n=2 Tax=Haloferax gibbonsii TaxID=35746 RepID=A0A0K1IVB7_HALGI|nr:MULTISPECIES: KaiC domain-containing protein [Haloferax]AKU08379.1 circadian clock protein KaiC [Haloferax gibbonsii]ELZ80766.1 recombinase A [Haloferax gibbonsii ATCC 33959]RDZ52486.1 KaiC domain-containing protein [Haloferax sp. Atlit-4N]REA03659.1 KaiC domain-containing protein [Haloferax sp. Atlit-6N]
MSDDDWFERALRERDDGETDADDADPDESEQRDDGETDGSPGSDAVANPADEPSEDTPENGTGGVGEPLSFEDGDPLDGDDAPFDGDDDPFSTDFATAFENAPMPDAGGGLGGEQSGDEFGFGPGPGESEPPSFDDEELDSDIDRIDIGIEGLDDMILGGVPERSLMVTIGSAGTGKTTFGLQFLRKALEDGDSGVYITLEESRERILDTADEKGWDFSKHESEGRLAVVDLDPVEMANSLSSIRNDLPRLVEEFGADRLVLDSVSLLEMMYDHPSKRRSEVFNFTRSLKDAGVTTMLTSEADQSNPYVSRHGIVEYLSDAVFVLQYVRNDDFRETRLAIEIQKIRDANHSRETKPYELTNEGISVYQQANIF